MPNSTYELFESVSIYLGLGGLFILMGLAVHDVLKKNDVPLVGKLVVYGVLGAGALGFLAKGLIEMFWISTGV
ncbi:MULTISPECIES: DUF2788 domain-containing protein [Salinimonas]|uniref:DUF2788 domain-containing protein n=2 Tax=Salinimonas TaxID=288793 RepID=A0A5B7YE25_9ALTE|nr:MULTISPECIES: DUF2788 domain-containing protein [Salinimonas]MBD3584702.1 DUF2788 domain-containing protein [Salinimonas profundi]QCZ93690.1 DUF2788 domain-containing protein [Salinimonas iocasae]